MYSPIVQNHGELGLEIRARLTKELDRFSYRLRDLRYRIAVAGTRLPRPVVLVVIKAGETRDAHKTIVIRQPLGERGKYGMVVGESTAEKAGLGGLGVAVEEQEASLVVAGNGVAQLAG
jgi:hypothetical protein